MFTDMLLLIQILNKYITNIAPQTCSTISLFESYLK